MNIKVKRNHILPRLKQLFEILVRTKGKEIRAQKILRCDYEKPSYLSGHANECINGIIHPDPAVRWKPDQILNRKVSNRLFSVFIIAIIIKVTSQALMDIQAMFSIWIINGCNHWHG